MKLRHKLTPQVVSLEGRELLSVAAMPAVARPAAPIITPINSLSGSVQGRIKVTGTVIQLTSVKANLAGVGVVSGVGSIKASQGVTTGGTIQFTAGRKGLLVLGVPGGLPLPTTSPFSFTIQVSVIRKTGVFAAVPSTATVTINATVSTRGSGIFNGTIQS